ncbi:MAG: Rrf2 family transcriptional regulator [Candidatus Omnitrophica bacterium]|nr:Rrf2 family transcriptional regulator [Candidatus Omnitrophota bacterium]MBU1656838.1 Rrf2 family transcriptional regulator [Candidatus Omnitrophota bacterium]MBU1783898.1 Rrf2 family transcriptional regulator [Candidatus Omnitrophota bacterium]MBU1851436.1 Rrf2 family transcriptional regulator [Candidatus Omnitrophota bacterium]
MKMITRDTDYAIRALSYMVASGGDTATVSALSKKLGIPRAYLRNILQRLGREGLLESTRGKGGGFSLVRDPKKITVFSLMEIFQGEFQLSDHIFRGKICPEVKVCSLKMKLDLIENRLIKELRSISIRSIVTR